MTLLGFALVAVGLAMVIASRISSKPPLLYFGLPGVVVAAIGIAVLASNGIDLKDQLPVD
jgi:hypothetical protein